MFAYHRMVYDVIVGHVDSRCSTCCWSCCSMALPYMTDCMYCWCPSHTAATWTACLHCSSLTCWSISSVVIATPANWLQKAPLHVCCSTALMYIPMMEHCIVQALFVPLAILWSLHDRNTVVSSAHWSRHVRFRSLTVDWFDVIFVPF